MSVVESADQLVNVKDSIVPVTIKQILALFNQSSPGPYVMIDGQPRKVVTIVGLIRSTQCDGGSTIYEIDDGTGIIKVLDLTKDEPLSPWVYCRVLGRLTLHHSEQNPIGAFSVRRVTDWNQIPYHMLQALYVHLHSTRSPPNGSVCSQINRSTVSPPRSVASEIAPKICGREDLVNQAVLGFLRRANSREGTPRQEIIAMLTKEFSVEEIDEAIAGLRYQTDIYELGPDRWLAN
jgi:hypothetical protein